jgi:hypothetical protein
MINDKYIYRTQDRYISLFNFYELSKSFTIKISKDLNDSEWMYINKNNGKNICGKLPKKMMECLKEYFEKG